MSDAPSAPAPGASFVVIDDSTIAPSSTAESTSTCDLPSLEAASPEAASPEAASPELVSPEAASPEAASPETAAPEVAPEAAPEPSETAKPSAKPSAFAKSLKSPSIPPIAVKAAAGFDEWLLRLNKITQTPSGIDALLAVVCYSARLGAVTLNTAAGRALLHEPAYRLAVLLASRPSIRSVFVQTSSSSLKTDAAAAALILAKRLRSLGSLLTEARMMLRLWALLSMYVWARSLLKQLLAKQITAVKTEKAEKEGEDVEAVAAAALPGPTKVESLIGWTQLLSCIGYQVTENYAYLSSKGVLGASPAKQGTLFLWSSRSFSVYVAVELARGAYNIVNHGATDTPAKKAAAIELHRNFARFASLAPMMGHWSMKKGFMSEAGIAICGFIPAALQFHKLWYAA